MLIGVSGSHCSGKSTLIDAFCERHPEFTRLAESYEELDELWSEVTVEVLIEQLEFQIEQLRSLDADNVIVERTPLDFVAYLQALNDLGRSSFDASKTLERTRDAVRRFDLVVFVPTEGTSIYVPVEEDRELRSAVNHRLRELIMEGNLVIDAIEVFGSNSQRVELLDNELTHMLPRCGTDIVMTKP